MSEIFISTQHIISNKMRIARYFFSVAVMLMVGGITGCSGTDPVTPAEEEKEKVVETDSTETDGISFSLAETDFGEESQLSDFTVPLKSNAVSTSYLSSGLEGRASLSKEPIDRMRQTTPRALSSGRYTVLAYDEAGALQAKLEATAVAGKFSSKDTMHLDPGTYTFVCLNDKVDLTADGDINVSRANAATARIGRTVMTVSGPRLKVPLVMNHVGVRVRISLEAMVNIPNNVKAVLYDNKGNTATLTKYNPMDGTYETIASGTFADPEESFPSTGSTDFSKETYVSTSAPAGYHYFLPDEGLAIQFKFTAGDQIYCKPLAGVMMFMYYNLGGGFAPNSSYYINLKLINLFKYLFSDGSVDLLQHRRSRTPIAIVVSETDRTAIALHDANNGVPTMWTSNRKIYNNPVAEQPGQSDQIEARSKGLHWTWDASGSLDGTTVKANEPDKCPAFYYAAHYNPGVSLTGPYLSKWYLGANTDWKNAYLYLGFGTNTKVNAASAMAHCYYHVVNKAFTDVGGTSLFSTSSSIDLRKFWSATYYRDFNTGVIHIFKDGSTDGSNSLSDKDVALVRAFIHY